MSTTSHIPNEAGWQSAQTEATQAEAALVQNFMNGADCTGGTTLIVFCR